MSETMVGQRESFLKGYQNGISDAQKISLALRHIVLRSPISAEALLVKLDAELDKLRK